MEETRSFGYICPKCGKAVMARRSAFSLAAAAAHIECPCGESDMLIETDGSKFRMWVPCGLCGETHQAECSAEAVLHGRGIGLACPKTRQICCYIGQEEQVSAQMEQLAVRAAKEKAQAPGGLHRQHHHVRGAVGAEGHCGPGRHPLPLRQHPLWHPGSPGLRGSVLPGLRRQAASPRRHRRGPGPALLPDVPDHSGEGVI